jgi:hypothetical protein
MNCKSLRPLLVARLMAVVAGLALMPIPGMAMQRTSDDCRNSIAEYRDFPSSENPIVVSMKELQKNPEDYYGKTVTVDGQLHRDFNDNVFTIASGDQDVLVISTVPKGDTVVALEHSLKSGKDVRITGFVAPYDRDTLECAYGPLNLESREDRSFTKNPVLIVDRTPKKTAAPISWLLPTETQVSRQRIVGDSVSLFFLSGLDEAFADGVTHETHD